MVDLQPVTTDDLPALLAVIQTAYAEYDGKLDPPSGARNESVTKLAQKLNEGHALKALLDDQIVGCVFYENRGDRVYFGRLAVLPAYRRQGIARQLVEGVEQYAADQQIAQVTMGVRLALPGHIDYYTRLGYQISQYRCHPGYTHYTSVDMVKTLAR
jgi:predicted N-acetyltransferase YhbS